MNPNDFSPKVSPAKATLHPNLQVALSSLNVNLEEELARFRQEQKQRKGITIAQSQSESPPVTGHASLISSATDVSGESETSHETDFSPPDSYLASSEELLRHLNQEGEKGTFPSTERLQNQNHQQSPPSSYSSWRDYLLTPLGVAGVLIFFLSGTLLSMMLVNLAQARFSDASSTVETSDRSSSESEQSTPESTDSSSPEIPNRPNLAEDEFVQLDVDNLVEAEPSADQPRTETPSCGREFYCVMVEKPNQAEYDKTRQLVADAYLREFPEIGQVLQVGAFKRESEAKNLQKRLDQRGITATIYYP